LSAGGKSFSGRGYILRDLLAEQIQIYMATLKSPGIGGPPGAEATLWP